MKFWEKIRLLFWKREGEAIKKDFDEEALIYNGDEQDCWACQMPIHANHKKRRLNNKPMHKICFKKLKRIALRGDPLEVF